MVAVRKGRDMGYVRKVDGISWTPRRRWYFARTVARGVQKRLMTGFSFQAYLWLKILKLITVTEAAHKCKVFDSWHICRTYLVFVAVCTWHPTNIGHQHKLLFYQSLYGNVFTFLVLSPGGTLIFYNLQVTTWSMTVDKTYPKTFVSDFLFHKKVTNKTKSFVFLNVVFLTNYYREIFNEEILCSQNYLLLPFLPDTVTNFHLD